MGDHWMHRDVRRLDSMCGMTTSKGHIVVPCHGWAERRR
jgi:hypothetical protein